ncbi:hypothetical protein C8A05DRAFT_39596, partial [Staphylotrichum tortipilum]
MPGMGTASVAAAVAANCRASFPNIKLALIVGVCGVDGQPAVHLSLIVPSDTVI